MAKRKKVWEKERRERERRKEREGGEEGEERKREEPKIVREEKRMIRATRMN